MVAIRLMLLLAMQNSTECIQLIPKMRRNPQTDLWLVAGPHGRGLAWFSVPLLCNLAGMVGAVASGLCYFCWVSNKVECNSGMVKPDRSKPLSARAVRVAMCLGWSRRIQEGMRDLIRTGSL